MCSVLVSIIVPVYNVDAYVHRCINSLMNQTLKEIEIICINDCSSDYSLYILEKLAAKDKRISIINNEKNLGVAQSRNLGLEASKGEYIGFVDGDDYVALDFYEKLYIKAQKNDSDIVKGFCKMVYPNNLMKEHWGNQAALKAKKKKWFIPTYYNHGFLLSIYKKSFIDEYKVNFCNLTNGEDIVFLLKALCWAKKFDVVTDTHYYYYQRPNSATYGYKEETTTAILNHFIYQVEFLNSLDLCKKDYLEYFSKQIIPAFERWFFIFKKFNFDESIYLAYVKGLINIYKLSKYKEVFNNKHYLKALKDGNVGKYLKEESCEGLKLFLILFNLFPVLLYRRKKTFVFNISTKNKAKKNVDQEGEFLSYLEKIKFKKHLEKLSKSLGNKKIVIYGTGLFFQAIKEHYDLDQLNIIAVADKKFQNHEEGEEFLGYPVCAPDEINNLNPDYVLVATRYFINVVEDLEGMLLKDSSIKIRPLIKKPCNELLKEIWV